MRAGAQRASGGLIRLLKKERIMFYTIHYTIDFNRTMDWILITLAYALIMKTITGYRFPWETCICCGKKVREHKKEEK